MLSSNAKVVADIITDLSESDGLCFRKAISDDHLAKLFEKHKIDFRDRLMPPDVTLLAFCSQLIGKDRSCRRAVTRILNDRESKGLFRCSTSTSAYCQARTRLPLPLVVDLAKQTAQFLESDCPPQWLWKGHHVKMIDGSTLTMPDTQENQERWPQHGKQSEGVGFPIMRVVAIMSLATAAISDFAYGPWQGKETGELALARRLLSSLEKGDLLLADRYYCSYFFIAMLQELGIDLVTRLHGARDYDFRTGKRLGKGDHLVELIKPPRPAWMEKDAYEKMPSTLTVREIKSSKDGDEDIIVVTTLVDPGKYSRTELASVYKKRWNVELDLRSIKSVMGMDILSCKTPDMIEKEVWTYILTYNLIRQLICQAANKHKIEPRTISFTGALQAFDAFYPSLRGGDHLKVKRAYELMLDIIAENRIGNRPGRREPKAVKRRPKAYPLLQTSRSEAHQGSN
jgi:hypothetical protein